MVLTEADLRSIRQRSEQIEYDTYVRPAVLRCGQRACYEIWSVVRDASALSIPYGLELLADKWLPPDVWRLTDRDGTLLYDCRESS